MYTGRFPIIKPMKIRTYTRKAAFKIKFYTTHITFIKKYIFQMAHKIAQIVTNKRSKNEILRHIPVSTLC